MTTTHFYCCTRESLCFFSKIQPCWNYVYELPYPKTCLMFHCKTELVKKNIRGVHVCFYHLSLSLSSLYLSLYLPIYIYLSHLSIYLSPSLPPPLFLSLPSLTIHLSLSLSLPAPLSLSISLPAPLSLYPSLSPWTHCLVWCMYGRGVRSLSAFSLALRLRLKVRFAVGSGATETDDWNTNIRH